MTITAGITNSFRSEVLQRIHDIVDDEIKMALYSSAATLGKDTTAYSATNEISGTGYTAGGQVLSGVVVNTEDDVVFVDFDNPQWAGSTIAARAALIYNATRDNRSVCVIDFGRVISSSSEIFRFNTPPANARQAIIRFP